MWPFRKKQAEPQQGYEGQILTALEAQGSGAAGRKVITGYVQAAASCWGETFAMAEVQASEAVRSALSPARLAEIGRDQILAGASFYRVSVMAGGIHLQRPLSVYRLAQGGGWQIQLGEPSHPVMVNVTDAEVAFLPWQTMAANPFTPVAPWRTATGTLASEIEDALVAEAGGPLGSVLFIAKASPYPDADMTNKVSKRLKPALDFTGPRRGKLATISYQGVANRGFSMDSQGKPFRIGMAPPQAVADLRSQMGAEILASCSVPPAMLQGGASGPSTITARRNFEKTIVPARFRIISELLSVAFSAPVQLTYPIKYRADNSTAARTVSALQKAGVDLAEAMELAGLR